MAGGGGDPIAEETNRALLPNRDRQAGTRYSSIPARRTGSAGRESCQLRVTGL